MTPDGVLSLARDSGVMMLALAGPILGASLLMGLVVSVIQAVTQVQEATLTFIPKLIAVFLVVALLGNWMLGHLIGYTVTLFSNLNGYGQ
ncbi:MAG: flagellar biosynthesis protein FliQ [Dehalococcoidia bacterium]|nr:flagellar biosynthesis protein FliQ [Dehalococcoidia bacterium]